MRVAKTATLNSELFRRHSKTKRGAIGSPFCIFGVAKNCGTRNRRDLRTLIVELDVYGDAKLGGGGAYSSLNVCDGGGRAMRRDLSFAAGEDVLSS